MTQDINSRFGRMELLAGNEMMRRMAAMRVALFGLGGVGAAFFGWLADVRGINFVFEISTLLPLLGIVAAFLPDLKKIDRG